MANLALSDVAPKVALSPGGETYVNALGDGTAMPGDAVGITQADGKVVQTLIGTSELFVGFLDINVETDMDTAIVAGIPCKIIVPQSAHIYNVHIEDPATTVEGAGFSMTFSNTAGAMEGAASAILGLARLAEDAVNTDVYGKVRWD